LGGMTMLSGFFFSFLGASAAFAGVEGSMVGCLEERGEREEQEEREM
jgi:hypothetical protein